MPSQTLLGVCRGGSRRRVQAPATESRNQSTRASAAGRLRRHVGTRGGQQGVGVAAVAAVGLGAAVVDPVPRPSSRWPRGGTGSRPCGGPRISCGPTSLRASTSKPAGAVNTSSCHSIHGPAATGGPSTATVDPADLRRRRRLTVPPRAWASTWAPKQIPSSGIAALDDVAHQRRLGLDRRRRLRSVDVPLRAQREHELDAVERRPAGGVLALALGEREAALAQPVADEAGIGAAGVPDQHRAHRPRVPVRSPSECWRCIGVCEGGTSALQHSDGPGSSVRRAW